MAATPRLTFSDGVTLMYETDDPEDEPPDDDDDNVTRHRRPLDLALAVEGGMDGQGGDETMEDWDDEDGPLFAQDAAGDGDSADDDARMPRRLEPPRMKRTAFGW